MLRDFFYPQNTLIPDFKVAANGITRGLKNHIGNAIKSSGDRTLILQSHNKVKDHLTFFVDVKAPDVKDGLFT